MLFIKLNSILLKIKYKENRFYIIVSDIKQTSCIVLILNDTIIFIYNNVKINLINV